jgi:hypothetical protein
MPDLAPLRQERTASSAASVQRRMRSHDAMIIGLGIHA